MKRKYIVWMISLLFSFIGFLLIENAFTINPDVISGNGNLGILMIILFSPSFIASYLLTFILVREKSSHVKNRKINVVILLVLLIICAMLILASFHYAKELIDSLGGIPTNPKSKIYRFGWFNQYTNSMYFNVYTFLLTHSIVVILSGLSVLSKLRK